MSMIKGNVITSENTEHPIIFMGEKDADQFYGVMLTHSNQRRYNNNIKMESEHFEIHNKSGVNYSFQYSDTHFTKLLLIKKGSWGPYKIVGNLTPLGIEYVEGHIDPDNPTSWAEYIEQ